MACYLGCRGCSAKLRWLLFITALIAAAALLALGLVKVSPGLTTLFDCTTKQNALTKSGGCWVDFWHGYALWFILSCVGAACLLISLLTCCCFLCASAPKPKNQQQFIQGGGYDSQYQDAPADPYYTAPGAKGVASV